jgi:SAM-dependent methyltransferase
MFRGLRNTTIKAKAIFCLMTSKHYLSALPVRSTAASGSQVYESERAVNEYLLAHYGDAADQMPYDFGPKDGANFSGYLAQLCIDKRKGMQNGRALDVGCAVGGLTFRLVPGFKEVVGIDYSQHFVDAANQMKSTGQMNFTILKQGNIFEPRRTSFPKDIDRSKASFYHGDACNLEKSLGVFSSFISRNTMNTLNYFFNLVFHRFSRQVNSI